MSGEGVCEGGAETSGVGFGGWGNGVAEHWGHGVVSVPVACVDLCKPAVSLNTDHPHPPEHTRTRRLPWRREPYILQLHLPTALVLGEWDVGRGWMGGAVPRPNESHIIIISGWVVNFRTQSTGVGELGVWGGAVWARGAVRVGGSYRWWAWVRDVWGAGPCLLK